MKSSNTFNLSRFGVYLNHSLINNARIIAYSLAGLCGGIFILLLLIQSDNNFRPLQQDDLLGIFLFLFFAVGIIYTGTAFPSLRTKEKTMGFLMLPVSTFEKFSLELLSRIILFIIAMPLIFYLVYIIEGYFVDIVVADHGFQVMSIFTMDDFARELQNVTHWVYVLIPSAALLVLNIPFTGSTIFMKHPLLKTLFAVAIIFFFHVLLIIFYVKVLELQSYRPANDSIVFMKNPDDVIRFFAVYSIIINIGLLVTAYLKLKEKEV